MTTTDTFPGRLEIALLRAGVTPIELSRLLGLNPRTAGAWLRGEHLPQRRFVRDIARHLNCDPVWLWTGSPAPEVAAA